MRPISLLTVITLPFVLAAPVPNPGTPTPETTSLPSPDAILALINAGIGKDASPAEINYLTGLLSAAEAAAAALHSSSAGSTPTTKRQLGDIGEISAVLGSLGLGLKDRDTNVARQLGGTEGVGIDGVSVGEVEGLLGTLGLGLKGKTKRQDSSLGSLLGLLGIPLKERNEVAKRQDTELGGLGGLSSFLGSLGLGGLGIPLTEKTKTKRQGLGIGGLDDLTGLLGSLGLGSLSLGNLGLPLKEKTKTKRQALSLDDLHDINSALEPFLGALGPELTTASSLTSTLTPIPKRQDALPLLSDVPVAPVAWDIPAVGGVLENPAGVLSTLVALKE